MKSRVRNDVFGKLDGLTWERKSGKERGTGLGVLKLVGFEIMWRVMF